MDWSLCSLLAHAAVHSKRPSRGSVWRRVSILEGAAQPANAADRPICAKTPSVNRLYRSFAARRAGVRPPERLRIAVGPIDVTANLPREIARRVEDAAGDHIALDVREPEFDLIEPRRVGPTRPRIKSLHGAGKRLIRDQSASTRGQRPLLVRQQNPARTCRAAWHLVAPHVVVDVATTAPAQLRHAPSVARSPVPS